MEKVKTIALVAHDNRKEDMVEWVEWNCKIILQHHLICTGTTGRLIEETLRDGTACKQSGLVLPSIQKLKSGPLGGDQQLGALITEGKIDVMIFFWDPMQPQPHDVDVKALLRIAVVYNIPVACNRATADFMISSPLMNECYEPVRIDYADYSNREVVRDSDAHIMRALMD
ncbi:MAG: methylglyoxal synthase [Desulfobacteraceae bacterium]|nr:MAG: methylglyoxal synthase [Desulfobacteraceae bacterium]